MMTGDDSGADEDDSSSCPLKTMGTDFKSALDQFREKWKTELQGHSNTGQDTKQNTTAKDEDLLDSEFRARELFLQGADLEKMGKVYDALRFYRLAIQIVPDIEFKIYEAAKGPIQSSAVSSSESNNNEKNCEAAEQDKVNENNTEVDDDEDLENVNLLARFQMYLTSRDKYIDMKADTTATHISHLPMEIILLILRWVVSANLDLRSLEQCAGVCKGFYVSARDEEIWRLACLKVWGLNTGFLDGSPYLTWRNMFIERCRVHFNGCYISKTNYLRYGENSFQDQYYRPIQLVEYYRYVRFFPDGQILMMTSAEEPQMCVGKLRLGQNRSDILKGHYRLREDNVVVIVLERGNRSNELKSSRRKQQNAIDLESQSFSEFHVEFNILGSAKKRFWQLQWKRYSIIQNKNKRTDFHLTNAKFPPLWFSRVKSYHLESEVPLI